MFFFFFLLLITSPLSSTEYVCIHTSQIQLRQKLIFLLSNQETQKNVSKSPCIVIVSSFLLLLIIISSYFRGYSRAPSVARSLGSPQFQRRWTNWYDTIPAVAWALPKVLFDHSSCSASQLRRRTSIHQENVRPRLESGSSWRSQLCLAPQHCSK